MAGTVRTDLSRPGSVAKHQAILEAAEEIFLRAGYLGTNMDEVAVRSGVSKQTVYKHFGSKEALFVDLVTAMTSSAGDRVLHDHIVPDDAIEVARHLEAYAERQLSVVLTPKLLQLRRLVIGEVERFPDLAQALYASGPRRAMDAQATLFRELTRRGLLAVDDPLVAASQFNWLVMGEPLNNAMLLGDTAIPSRAKIRRHCAAAVRTFLAAYAPRSAG
jgi:TetR/AcrR family transcriptional repressor of mexJK operon